MNNGNNLALGGRLRRSGSILSFVERVILALPRRRLRKVSHKKLRVAIGALEKCRDTKAKLLKYELPHLMRMYDACQFCIMYSADLVVLTCDTGCREDWWESRLYGRLLAMTMLECVEDIPTILGKDFRHSLTELIPDAAHRERLTKLSKSLSDYRKTHEAKLRPIRQIAAAHRDHDPELQIALVQSLDIKALIVLASELEALQSEFCRAMTEVLMRVDVIREIVQSFGREVPKSSTDR